MEGKSDSSGKRKQSIQITLAASAAVLCFASVLVACAKKTETAGTSPTAGAGGTTGANGATDYSVPNHWLSLPSAPTKAVDVFYLYPTAFQKANASDPNISTIDDPTMLKGSKSAFARQVTAFENVANIYAPYYRQADATYTLNLPLDEQAKVIGGTPTGDAVAAITYYMKHYNNGRPFILAGHSQGSNIMLNLLSGYMKENSAEYKKMIVAYVIGYSVTPDFLAKNPHLKFAEGADDTGVIVSYNTEAPGLTVKNPVLQAGALAINPITWTRTEEPATVQQSAGSLLYDANGNLETVKNYADAKIDKTRGVVVCSTADLEKLSREIRDSSLGASTTAMTTRSTTTTSGKTPPKGLSVS